MFEVLRVVPLNLLLGSLLSRVVRFLAFHVIKFKVSLCFAHSFLVLLFRAAHSKNPVQCQIFSRVKLLHSKISKLNQCFVRSCCAFLLNQTKFELQTEIIFIVLLKWFGYFLCYTFIEKVLTQLAVKVG